jgi:hypothetical protein
MLFRFASVTAKKCPARTGDGARSTGQVEHRSTAQRGRESRGNGVHLGDEIGGRSLQFEMFVRINSRLLGIWNVQCWFLEVKEETHAVNHELAKRDGPSTRLK